MEVLIAGPMGVEEIGSPAAGKGRPRARETACSERVTQRDLRRRDDEHSGFVACLPVMNAPASTSELDLEEGMVERRDRRGGVTAGEISEMQTDRANLLVD